MKNTKPLIARLIFGLGITLAALSSAHAADPLPSWNEGETKQAIIDFVNSVTTEDSPDFVPVSERIATFDNDGTLWSEQPMYVQLFFAFDRVRAMAPDNPQWKTEEPFASLLKGNVKLVLDRGMEAIGSIIMATHAGMTTTEFEDIVVDWMKSARHPGTKEYFYDMVYQPMLELLNYLRAYEFKTYIVSGGGVEFMRPWTEPVYGIPPEQVIGSSVKTRFEMRDGEPVLVRLPELNFIDDKEGKPVGIHSHIGRRPIFASGNSDGDLQMLQYTTAGEGARFGLLLHHTGGKGERAYDRDSNVGRLDKALDEAPKQGWTVIDMKKDWKVSYPFQK